MEGETKEMNIKKQLQLEILELEKAIEEEREKMKREQDQDFIKDTRSKMTIKQLELYSLIQKESER